VVRAVLASTTTGCPAERLLSGFKDTDISEHPQIKGNPFFEFIKSDCWGIGEGTKKGNRKGMEEKKKRS
jgi:hypothetical protein